MGRQRVKLFSSSTEKQEGNEKMGARTVIYKLCSNATEKRDGKKIIELIARYVKKRKKASFLQHTAYRSYIWTERRKGGRV